ncbi:F0F1 ATP synthase subunit B [Cohnella herbarum]|uniref:F0F1 ATP synthase subunit B n=1 Tax=Cohnella herbarum TaxID=2728023 RepID=A0A7Z2VPU9_9BACL|nr:F0F1 ATP synthase subunit B [Cohnella herbarum]QJD86775.1 F0F1 ATP synthase subunit B [Cohnella herbarum]
MSGNPYSKFGGDLILFHGASLTNFILQLVFFFLLYVLLKKFAITPLLTVMERRKMWIENHVADWENLKKQQIDLQNEQINVIREAKVEARTIISDLRDSAWVQAEQIVNEAKDENNLRIARAVNEIEMEKELALILIQEQSKELAERIVKKILH